MASESVIDTSAPFDVDYSFDDVTKAWQTQRLRMIRIGEGNDHIRQALARTLQDPVVMALASSSALQPTNNQYIDDEISAISSATLGVAIALLPEEAGKFPNFDGAAAADPATPVIIGNMTIGWGGFSARTAHHRNASMSISLSRDFQGKGYGGEALNWLIDWAFGHAGLHTVSLTAASYNQRGIHLYKKLGFRVEGRRKETIYFNRGWHDEIDFGMTEHEWDALKQKK